MLKTLLLLSLILFSSQAPASYTHMEVKAAFIMRFMGFIETPYVNDAFKIRFKGGQDQFQQFSKVFEGKNLNGKNFDVKEYDPAENNERTDVLFITGEDKDTLFEKLGGQIVISERKDGLEKGSIINFILIGDKIRFEINNEQALKKGIKINSRLLKLAKRVL